MNRLVSFGWMLAAAMAMASCTPEPVREPPLTADPPVASNADEGAVQTELERGIEYVKHERFAEAREHFQKAIEIKPTPTAWTYLGVTAERTSDRGAAEEAYQNALKLDPAFVEAAQNLAALYLDDPARPDDAIAVLKPALEKNPDARLYQNFAYALSLKGDVPGSSKAYEAALAKGEDAQLRFAYGAMLHQAKQPGPAAEQLKKALDAVKGADAALLMSIGRLLGVTKAYGDCVRAIDRAIAVKSDEPEMFTRRGTCKHELKDERGAQEDFQAAIKIDPNYAAAHYYLGLSHLALRARGRAVTELEKAAQLGGDGPIGKAARAKIAELTTKKK